MPSSEFQKLYALLLERRRPPEPIAVEALRHGMESVAFPLHADVGVETVEDGPIPYEILRPSGVSSDRILLYLHGGGFVMGSPNTHRKLAAALGRAARRTVILPDYPLAPEHPFPTALEAVVQLAGQLKGRYSSLVVAGDSAGGGLALSLLQIVRDRCLPGPERALLMSPWLDVARDKPDAPDLVDRDPIATPYDLKMMRDWYVGPADVHQPYLSAGLGDPARLPPILIQVGGAEILLPDAVTYGDRARNAGAEVTVDVWPDMVHVWQAFCDRVPEATEAVLQGGAWLA